MNNDDVNSEKKNAIELLDVAAYYALRGFEPPAQEAGHQAVPDGIGLTGALAHLRGMSRAKRERVRKEGQNAPNWAQGIVQAEDVQRRFAYCVEATKGFAKKTGHQLVGTLNGGYNLRQGEKLVLRNRHIYVIIKYLKAQHIWREYISDTPPDMK